MSFWKPLFSRFARPAGNRTNNSKLKRHRKAFARARFEPLEPRALLTTVIGDFNHDGIADLAIGMPTLTVDGLTNAGEVRILYGTVPSPTAGNPVDPGLTGLTALNSQIFTRDTPGLHSSAQAGDQFGSALAVGDFNHDGFTDLAVGASGQAVGSATGAGAVYILFGGKKGLKGTGSQVWTQDSQSINGVAQAGDGFGSALAVGDFNGDHKIDLAIGVPGENVTANSDAGAVNIIFGRSTGLTASSDELIDQSQLNAGTVGVNDLFGSALAAGDFNGDGFADLAVGAPGQTVGGNANAGAVSVIYGSQTGLAAKGNQFWTPGANGLSGTSNAAGQFGFALASGDFNDDSRWDLAIGSPGENVGSTTNAGAVHVLLGSSSRLRATGNQLWDEGNTLVTGSALTAGDRFGASLAAGSMNGDRLADLAIGAPGETVTSDAGAGSVTVLYAAQASSTQAVAGLGTTNAQTWDQSKLTSTGDSPTAGEGFGTTLAIGDFNGDRIADLASETAAEDHNGGGPGAASIIFSTTSGLNAGGSSATAEATQVWIPADNAIFPDPNLFATNLREGNAFLTANKKKAGVITTADGLQYKIIHSNPSGAMPTDANSVQVQYTGTLTNGTVFDASSQHPDPGTTNDTSFNVTGVVPGFSEALKLMHVGDHFIVYLPTNLAYGLNPPSSNIPVNAVLIFDLTLDAVGPPIQQ